MKAEELVTEIRTAFKDVKLEDGVGLWEGQGVDDYADAKTMLELRNKDERSNWDSIPYKDLVDCQSSLSFFDAKGMRFCLPKFLLFDLLSEKIYDEEGINSPDPLFMLGYNLNDEYQKNRFSLLDGPQIQCIVFYLEFKLQEDPDDAGLERTLIEWKRKLI